MSTAGYLVEGMTCGYCMGKVHEKIRSISGVTKVSMDLVAGGLSPLLVMSETKLVAGVVRDAIEGAGFGLLQPRGARVHPAGGGPAASEGDGHQDRLGMRFSIGGVRS